MISHERVDDEYDLNDRLSDNISGGYSEEYKNSANDANSISPVANLPKFKTKL